MDEPNLRMTIVGELISELDLLRDPGDGPFESQSSGRCSGRLPRVSQDGETTVKLLGAEMS